MNKLCTMLALVGGLFSLTNAQETEIKMVYKIDSTINVRFTGEDTTDGYRQQYSYYENGLTNAVVWSDWNKKVNEWDVQYRNLYNLDDDDEYGYKRNKELWSEQQQKWYPGERTYQRYTSKRKEYYFESQVWDTVTQSWYGRSIAETDSITNSQTWQKWDKDLQKWNFDNKTEYTYDDEGKTVGSLQSKWDVEAAQWVSNRRFTYSLDTNGRRIYLLEEKWDNSNKQWNYDSQDSMSYNTSGTEIKTLHWNYQKDEDQFQLHSCIERTKNRFGADSLNIYHEWNDETLSWEFERQSKSYYNDSAQKVKEEVYEDTPDLPNYISESVYDERGKSIEYTTYKVIDSETQVISSTQKNYYSLHEVEVAIRVTKPGEGSGENPSTAQDTNEATVVGVFPNPVSNILYIDGGEANKISISNANGAVLLEQESCKSVDVDVLQPGVYIAIITRNDTNTYVKFTKQ